MSKCLPRKGLDKRDASVEDTAETNLSFVERLESLWEMLDNVCSFFTLTSDLTLFWSVVPAGVS